MPTLHFKTENLTITVPSGTSLQEAVSLADSNFPFGCKRGSCGTCRCFVLSGMENLNPLTEHEKFLFATLTAVEPHERLGCQLIIEGDVTIES